MAVGRDVRDLKVGDRITTIGGFYATIAAIKDDVITISFGPDSTKAMIARWVTPERTALSVVRPREEAVE